MIKILQLFCQLWQRKVAKMFYIIVHHQVTFVLFLEFQTGLIFFHLKEHEHYAHDDYNINN